MKRPKFIGTIEPDPNSRLDYPCVSFKQGSCMPYWDLELCCGEYGIGCDADVCPVEGKYLRTKTKFLYQYLVFVQGIAER